MKPRQNFLHLVFFTATLVAAMASTVQTDGTGDEGWRVNQHWWGAHIPAHRLVRSAQITYDGVASVSFSDKVRANIKKHTEFVIGIKKEVISRQRVFLAKFPAEFGHGGDQIKLAS